MRRILSCLGLLTVLTAPCFAQLDDAEPVGVRFGNQLTQQWKVGVVIRADGGPCGGVFATVPVPTNWPSQQVRVVSEDLSPQIGAVKYRTLDDGVRQMLVSIPHISPSDTASALVTFEVTTSAIEPPRDTSIFVVPKRPPRDVRSFLGTSPYIESRHSLIRGAARDIGRQSQATNAWQQVEEIYDWVREKVEYKNGDLKGALAALRDGDGDCEELTSLFIAICRASKIPARTVWVPGHCYPEFYLHDPGGKGHWFPCQAAGTRDFGSMPDMRPILQKGDNFRVPEKSKPQRYVAEFCKMKSAGGRPNVSFVRQLLAGE